MGGEEGIGSSTSLPMPIGLPQFFYKKLVVAAYRKSHDDSIYGSSDYFVGDFRQLFGSDGAAFRLESPVSRATLGVANQSATRQVPQSSHIGASVAKNFAGYPQYSRMNQMNWINLRTRNVPKNWGMWF